MIGYLAFFSLPFYYLISWFPSDSFRKGAFLILSLLLFLPCLLCECWDLVYFQYTLKRCSFDLFLFFGLGDDQTLMQPMLLRFWYAPVLFIIWAGVFLKSISWLVKQPEKKVSVKGDALHFGLVFVLSFLLARNSFGPKPLGIMDAVQFENPVRSQLMLNAPFVLLKTIQNTPIPDYLYLDRTTERKIFMPIRNYASDSSELKPNIVVIIVESLGYERLGRTVNGIPLTPYLDSLLRTNFQYKPYAIAGGKTSIECLPALFSGIPSWMENPFILSNYSLNQVQAFPKLAYDKGYKTLFFHGSSEGSMRFGTTVKHLGFHDCFFQDRLKETGEAQGSWGYHDKTVLTNLQKQLRKSPTPFLACVFTLSTHEPYDIPHLYLNSHTRLNKEQASYRYLDDCIKIFFKEAARQKWYNHTVFVITGDHIPVHLDRSEMQIADYYGVPMMIFNPTGISIECNDHLNLVPALSSFLRWKDPIYSFGHESDLSIRYLNGLYHVWNNQMHLEFNEHLQQWNVRKNTSKDPQSLTKLKQRFYARIQRYRKDLRYNTLHP
jgi:phosphoglycerol transferase MdoB-like AlkP superfamily enzyme